ncbi:MAG: DUF58 domain-containing protein [Prevotellaceae bacterium]|jgi:uncharacterized protein (DUF58 family)|nr:DUF58 domain-containing protein [Prevotellaceae bacterium]
METADLLKKVRKIEIKTRGLSGNIFAGEYHSAFKGRGMTFSEVREYQPGDDVRNIDWNVTARFNAPFVKVFEEERELTVMLIVDVSASQIFGTQSKFKKDLIAELSAVLSFSASINNDKIGAMFFGGKVEKFIPPKKGRSHILRIIREILEFEPENSGTDLSESLAFLTGAMKKRCTAFILSDFMDFDENAQPRFEQAMKIASKKHDVVALRIYDHRETELPSVGLVEMADAETGQIVLVNTSRRKNRKLYSQWWRNCSENLDKMFSKYRIDSVNVSTSDDYIKPLVKMFKKRGA